jgi:hypothetical protein
MRVVLPSVEYVVPGLRLAPRPGSLEGKVIGFLDGWGRRNPDGSLGMYPLMEALWEELRSKFNVKGYLWLKKPSISEPVPADLLEDFLARADLVVNGEGA